VVKNTIKKDNDVALAKQKIQILREQLVVAEKILTANEQSLDELKSQKRALDSRVIKLQNMKKVQQQLLQKVLATPSASTIAATSTSTATSNTFSITKNNTRVTTPQNSKDEVSKSVTASNPNPPPPLPNDLQPPLPPSRSLQPPPPPLPPTPPTPKTPEKKAQDLTISSSRTEQTVYVEATSYESTSSSIVKRSTLVEEMNLTMSNLKKSTNSAAVSSSPTTSQKQASTRPNLLVSKQTDQKLEEIAKQSNQQATEKNDSLIVNAKVVNVVKTAKSGFKSPNKLASKSQTAIHSGVESKHAKENLNKETGQVSESDKSTKSDLINRQKLNQYLKNVTVNLPQILSKCNT
jgi:hypothetical protein